MDSQEKIRNLFASYKTLTGNTQQEAAAYLTLAHVVDEGFEKNAKATILAQQVSDLSEKIRAQQVELGKMTVKVKPSKGKKNGAK